MYPDIVRLPQNHGSNSPQSPKKKQEPQSPFRFEFGPKNRSNIEQLAYKRGPAVRAASKLNRGASLGLEIDTSLLPSQMSTAQPSGEDIQSPDMRQPTGQDSPLLPKLGGVDSPTLLNSPNAARRKPKIRSSTNLSETPESKNPQLFASTANQFNSPGTPLVKPRDKEQRSASKPSFRVRDSSSNSLLRTSLLTKPNPELAVFESSGISAPVSAFPYKANPTNSLLESLRGQEPTRRFSIRPAALGVERKHQKSNSCIPANISSLVPPPRSLAVSPAPQKASPPTEDLPKTVEFKWDISTLTGFNPNHFKENQDYSKVHSFALPSNRANPETVWTFLMADGHGTNGGLASKTAGDRLLHHLESGFREVGPSSASNLPEDVVRDIICACFEKTQEELKLDPADRFRSSGTTMVLVLFYREVFYFCNVGDSKVVFCSTGAHRLQLVCRYESKLHKPNDPEELKRIEAAGGQVWVLVDENSQKHVAPPRVWNRARTEPGLATSRSLGDTYGHTIGLSCRPGKIRIYPDITTKKLATNDKYLVLASDGVWDVMNTKDVMEKCNSFLPREAASEAAKRIVRDSAAVWNKVG